jgi:PAS domain S-box-containing protein
MPESAKNKKLFFLPADIGAGNNPQALQHQGQINADVPARIEELKKVNEELKQARRAALNLIEDGLLAKEALRESEERLRITTESAIDYAIITMNTERIIEGWSRGAELIFQYTAREVIGKSADIIFTDKDIAAGAPQQEMEKAKNEGKAEDERWHKRKDGTLFFVNGTMRPIYDAALTGYVKVARDMTQQKLIEQQKEDFIGIASHELKTPVTSIKAYTELLQEMCNEGDYVSGAPLIKKLSAQVDRLIELVHSLLDTTMLAEGGLALQLEQFKIGELIEECVENLQRGATSSHIIVRCKNETFIYADRDRIRQVLTNLISNALKYSPNGGQVTVDCCETAEGIKVGVHDEGIGISKEMQAKVFDRFFRVNGANANTFPGMGLGLYIAFNIIQRHGGKIWIESEPGKGSVFYFVLPYSKQIA